MCHGGFALDLQAWAKIEELVDASYVGDINELPHVGHESKKVRYLQISLPSSKSVRANFQGGLTDLASWVYWYFKLYFLRKEGCLREIGEVPPL